MPLTYTPQTGDILAFTIDFDRFDCENFWSGAGRWQYTCTIAYDGETIDAGVVRSDTTTRENPEGLGSMLGSFLSFFSAFIEAGEDGKQADLFPKTCRPLAEMLDAGKVALWADEIRRTVS